MRPLRSAFVEGVGYEWFEVPKYCDFAHTPCDDFCRKCDTEIAPAEMGVAHPVPAIFS